MGIANRAFALRDSLILLIIAAMLLPPATIDIAWASETDLPEPFNMDLTSYMPTDPEDAYTGFTLSLIHI